jgi:hypothetical protein
MVALVLTVPLGACGAGDAPAPVALRADPTTARIAVVEVERQCAVAATSFPTESGITDDLTRRLAAEGLTYAQWKAWRDGLATSPALVAQLADLADAGCPET